jgi:hypothetical protein
LVVQILFDFLQQVGQILEFHSLGLFVEVPANESTPLR